MAAHLKPLETVSFCSLQEFPLRMENQCYFKCKYNCDDKGELAKAGPARIESVIRFSKEYKNNVHVDLVIDWERIQN